MTLRAASLGPSARLAPAPLGGLRPPAASLRCAGSRRPPWGGLRPGSRVPIRGPPGPPGSVPFGALATSGVRAGPFGPFFGQPAVPPCAGAPSPARVPRRPARPRPLRGSGPAHCALASLAVAGPAGFPPAPPLGAGRPRSCGLPVPLAGPVCLRPRLRCAAGSLFGRPCCAWPWALCSAWPRRAPPSRALRASGPGCSRPGAVPGCRPAFSAPAPGRVGCAAAPAALLRFCAAFPGGVGFSPAPPRPAAPAGGSGGHEARLGGLDPPLRGPRFSRTSCGSPRGPGGPARAPSARLTVRKL